MEKAMGFERKTGAKGLWSEAERKGGWKCHWSNRSRHKLNEEASGRRLGGTRRLKMLTSVLKIAGREKGRKSTRAELTGAADSSGEKHISVI